VLGPFAGNLERLGITLKYAPMDAVAASKKMMGHDFDMTVISRWEPSLVPGTGESLLWGSALADRKPSYALADVKDRGLDAAIAAMGGARTMAALVPAAHAFDRIMRWQHYAVPLWRSNEIWLAHWDSVEGPDLKGVLDPTFVDLWWSASDALSIRQAKP